MPTSTVAYLFPGQGSQKEGMGAGFFEMFPEMVEKADSILGYSIKELCLEDPKNVLNKTQYTQPALYVVNALMYLAHIENTGKKPDYMAGHSLGEYNALFAAEVFDFGTGLRLVKERGEIMSETVGGGMAAVIGASKQEIEGILEKNSITTLDIANYNSPGHIVISGPKEIIALSEEIFISAGVDGYIQLQVSGAFHSRYMEKIRHKFSERIGKVEFKNIVIPVISNVEARPYEYEKIKYLLDKHIVCSVQWVESIRYLIERGVEEFIEIGPGRTLTKLVKRIKKGKRGWV